MNDYKTESRNNKNRKSMEDIIDLGYLKGYSSGMPIEVHNWLNFLFLYRITDLKEELIRYSGPNNWISDLLN